MSEDFNHLRTLAIQVLHTPFREPWQFRIEPEGYPDKDFDIYIKDITYGSTEIETEPENIGIQVLTFPNRAQPVTISLTMRDHEDRRVSKWFNSRVAKMINGDGTVNLPLDYVLTIRRFSLLHHGEQKETETDAWEVIPTQLGDVTEARDGEGLLEFPITFIKFRS